MKSMRHQMSVDELIEAARKVAGYVVIIIEILICFVFAVLLGLFVLGPNR